MLDMIVGMGVTVLFSTHKAIIIQNSEGAILFQLLF